LPSPPPEKKKAVTLGFGDSRISMFFELRRKFLGRMRDQWWWWSTVANLEKIIAGVGLDLEP
jgi:hypothetical protein